MNAAQVQTVFAGPQDCGSFFLDATGPIAPEAVEVRWQDTPRESCEEIDRIINTFWDRRTEASRREGFRLFNGPLCRLIDYQCENSQLKLQLGPTDYRDFVGTNLHNAYLRYTHGPQLLANPLGVSGILVSNDGYIVLGYRGRQVAFHAERLHPVGGCVTPVDGEAPPHPLQCLINEINEELGMDAGQIESSVCLGLVRDKQIVQPELLYRIQLKMPVDKVRQLMIGAEDSDEHSSLAVVRDDAASMVSFLQSHLQQLTPVALAGLLLHGLVNWGGGWFTSTRGYLHNLI